MVLLYFLLAGVATYVLNVFLIRYALRIRSANVPASANQIRWANRSKPLVGGISFFLVFFGVLVFLLLDPNLNKTGARLMPLVSVAVIGFLVGLFDDAYNTKPLVKFGGQVLAGLVLVTFGVVIPLTGLEAIDATLTVLWVVGMMNSFNMMDNMDGVSGTFSLVVLSALAVVLAVFYPADAAMLTLTLAMVGSHVAFLLLNWHPSKLYMGDTGSQLLGAVLAYIGIAYFWTPAPGEPSTVTWRAVAVPVLVYGVTLMDTLFVTVARIARGQSPFVGGRDHLSHHLVYFGVAERWVPALLALAGVVSATIGVAAMVGARTWSVLDNWLVLGYVLAVVAVFAWLYRLGAHRRALELAAQGQAPARSLTAFEKALEPGVVKAASKAAEKVAEPGLSRVAAQA